MYRLSDNNVSSACVRGREREGWWWRAGGVYSTHFKFLTSPGNAPLLSSPPQECTPPLLSLALNGAPKKGRKRKKKYLLCPQTLKKSLLSLSFDACPHL